MTALMTKSNRVPRHHVNDYTIRVYDIGNDKYADRYTIHVEPIGARAKDWKASGCPIHSMTYGSSANPFHPSYGVFQCAGENLTPNLLWGKRIAWDTLPVDVQRAVELRLADES